MRKAKSRKRDWEKLNNKKGIEINQIIIKCNRENSNHKDYEKLNQEKVIKKNQVINKRLIKTYKEEIGRNKIMSKRSTKTKLQRRDLKNKL